MSIAHFSDVLRLAKPSCGKYGIGQFQRRETLVDDQGKRLDLGTEQVLLEERGFVYGGRLREGNDDDFREVRIPQAGKEEPDRLRHTAHRVEYLPVVGLRGVEEEERVPGRRGIEHHESVLPVLDLPRERPEHGDLFGARRAKVFFQEPEPLCIQIASRRRLTSSL